MRTFITLIAISTLAACSTANGASDNDPQTSRTFAATGFDAVSLGGPDDVEIVEGKDFSVTATGSAKVLDKLEITVRDNMLSIERKREGVMSWSSSDRGARIRVTMPFIKRAAIGGSGDMDVGAPAVGSFEGAIGGSGDMKITRLAAEALSLSIGGSGDMVAQGTAKTASLSIAGSGNIDASRVATTSVSASVAGSGNISAAATGTASASTVGSGDITIKGTQDCKISKAGSGDVRCTI